MIYYIVILLMFSTQRMLYLCFQGLSCDMCINRFLSIPLFFRNGASHRSIYIDLFSLGLVFRYVPVCGP